MKLYKIIAAVLLAVLLLTLIQFLGSTSDSSDETIRQALENEQLYLTAGKSLTQGCIAKGMATPDMLTSILITKGRVCVELVTDHVSLLSMGRSSCDIKNEFCLYTLGYVRASIVGGTIPDNDQDLKDFFSEVKTSYEKYKANKGND